MAEPFPYTNLVDMLRYWSSRDAEKAAFIFVDKHRTRLEVSRRQLYELGGRWAAVLQEEGVGRNDRVVSTLPNGPERALCDVGIVMAGAVMVNAQCLMADGSDLLHVLRQSKASAVCLNPDLDLGPWHVLKRHVQLDPVTHNVTSASLSDLRKIFFIRRTASLCQENIQSSAKSAESSGTALQKDGFRRPDTGDFVASLQTIEKVYAADVEAEDTVVIMTTSGSTGFSKLVPNTHATLLKYFHLLKTLSGGSSSGGGIAFNSSPLGWAGGLTFKYIAQGKGRLVLDVWYGFPNDLAALVWESIVQEGCSDGIIMAYLMPKILALEGRKPWKIKTLLMGGQPFKTENVRQALQLAEKVVVGYPCTELHLIAALPVTDFSQYRDYLVGKPVPGSQVMICDAAGNEMPTGNKGLIQAKTPYMFSGYLNTSESGDDPQACFTADGFLKLKDVGAMLEDGSLLVEGRHGDAIHRGAYIFYPGWLESRIMQCCPGLQNVVVVGVPDRQLGEEICACFVPSDPSVSEEHVRRVVEEDMVATLEDPLSPRPRYYLSLPSLPTTYTDKPLRREVRRQATHRLSLD